MTPATVPVAFLGTWKITKVEASRPDLPHPVGGVTKTTQESDGVHMNSEATWSDGRIVKTNAVYKLDGNWYPVTGSPLADSVSVRVFEGGAFEARLRRGGVDVGAQRVTVSPDGRTLTADANIIGPQGTPISWKTTSTRE
jgi:hypothetical protein